MCTDDAGRTQARLRPDEPSILDPRFPLGGRGACIDALGLLRENTTPNNFAQVCHLISSMFRCKDRAQAALEGDCKGPTADLGRKDLLTSRN